MIEADGQIGLKLGISDRGEKVKNGVNQGVIADTSKVAQTLKTRKAAAGEKGRLFPIQPSRFHELWWEAGINLKLKSLKPPHTMRHTAAARDAFLKKRPLDAIQDRGRWRTPSAVERYRKAHDFLAALAAESDEIRIRAQKIRRKQSSLGGESTL